jgi:hypothetical protein
VTMADLSVTASATTVGHAAHWQGWALAGLGAGRVGRWQGGRWQGWALGLADGVQRGGRLPWSELGLMPGFCIGSVRRNPSNQW